MMGNINTGSTVDATSIVVVMLYCLAHATAHVTKYASVQQLMSISPQNVT